MLVLPTPDDPKFHNLEVRFPILLELKSTNSGVQPEIGFAVASEIGKLSIFNIYSAVSIPQILLSIRITLKVPRFVNIFDILALLLDQDEEVPSPQIYLYLRGLGATQYLAIYEF